MMTHKLHKRKPTLSGNIRPGDYALIVTADNEIEFLMPDLDEVDVNRPIPKLAIALIAIANLMGNDYWVSQTINRVFGTKKKNNSRNGGESKT